MTPKWNSRHGDRGMTLQTFRLREGNRQTSLHHGGNVTTRPSFRLQEEGHPASHPRGKKRAQKESAMIPPPPLLPEEPTPAPWCRKKEAKTPPLPGGNKMQWDRVAVETLQTWTCHPRETLLVAPQIPTSRLHGSALSGAGARILTCPPPGDDPSSVGAAQTLTSPHRGGPRKRLLGCSPEGRQAWSVWTS